MRAFALVLLVVLGATGCSGSSDSTLVDGVEITEADFAALHIDVAALDDDERAGSQLLLILREAFGTYAEADLGLVIEDAAIDLAYQEQVDRYVSRGGIDTVLAASNQTTDRVRVEAELDSIRNVVSETLVRTEADGFDIELAFEAYLLAEAEVCVQLIQLEAGPDFDAVADRLNAGEDFAEVARDVSIDPFAGREEGSGAGGDLGCSNPGALPAGLDIAALFSPLNEPTGPIVADTGLYLVVAYDRTTPELADVRDEVIDLGVEQQGPELFRLWAIGVLQSIEVEVADEYGVWGMLPETDPVPTVVAPYRIDDIIEPG